MDPWISLVAIFEFAVGVVYAYIATQVAGRPVAAAARIAAYQFGLWWYGLAAASAINGIEAGLVATGSLNLAGAITLYLLTILVDCALLWGLVSYLAYIYTGKNHLFELGAFYAAFYIGVLYYVFLQGPTGFLVHGGLPELTYAQFVGGPLEAWVVFGLLVPEFVAVFAYLSLYRRTTDRTQRYRIGLVAAGIILWFGVALVTPSGDTISPIALTIVKCLLSAISALIVLAAYRPPASIRRRFGVRGIDESAAEPAPGGAVAG